MQWRALLMAALFACGGKEEPGDCAGPSGVYQRGKNGGPSCCPGLEEYGRQVLAQVSGQPECTDPVGHAEFGCIEGRCGDGTCEPGEAGECGCTLDCPAR